MSLSTDQFRELLSGSRETRGVEFKAAGPRGDPLSSRSWPARFIATQPGTRRTLAIEHTVIEPFVGEKRDFFSLMLERDQGFVYPKEISKTIDALRDEYCDLDKVVLRLANEEHAESFSFYRGKLQSVARDGMPVPI
jgi:hypothetical protein